MLHPFTSRAVSGWTNLFFFFKERDQPFLLQENEEIKERIGQLLIRNKELQGKNKNLQAKVEELKGQINVLLLMCERREGSSSGGLYWSGGAGIWISIIIQCSHLKACIFFSLPTLTNTFFPRRVFSIFLALVLNRVSVWELQKAVWYGRRCTEPKPPTSKTLQMFESRSSVILQWSELMQRKLNF